MTFITKRIKAFEFALTGIYNGIKKETHLKIHLTATILVIAAGVLFKITAIEWIMIIGCCSMVIAAELMNTAIEKTCDLVSLEYHPAIKYIKDVSAGAVLLLCIASVVIGSLIFGKHFLALYQ